MTHAFKPWEIPTGGEPPPLDLCYEPRTGRRLVWNRSAWMLLIRKADGSLVPLPRTGALLEPGDEVLPPSPQFDAPTIEQVSAARRQGMLEYDLAHALPFDHVEGDSVRFDRAEPERWWWHRRELPHGRVLHLYPASMNARLSISRIDEMGFEGSWCYPHHQDGWRAVLGWNGEGDPPDGWTRHLETGRRRHDGTAATEYWNASEAPLGRRALGRTGP